MLYTFMQLPMKPFMHIRTTDSKTGKHTCSCETLYSKDIPSFIQNTYLLHWNAIYTIQQMLHTCPENSPLRFYYKLYQLSHPHPLPYTPYHKHHTNGREHRFLWNTIFQRYSVFYSKYVFTSLKHHLYYTTNASNMSRKISLSFLTQIGLFSHTNLYGLEWPSTRTKMIVWSR